jgi:hypothetical protein
LYFGFAFQLYFGLVLYFLGLYFYWVWVLLGRFGFFMGLFLFFGLLLARVWVSLLGFREGLLGASYVYLGWVFFGGFYLFGLWVS